MNSSNQLDIVGHQGIQHKSIITEKKFELNSMKWKYQNNFNLTIKSDQILSNLKIKNHLCEMHNNKITKIIEIVYHNKIYQIQDTYHLHIDPPQINHHNYRHSKDSTNTNSSDKNDNKNESKVYIFKNINRRGKQTDKKDKDSRNTKNIAKNFCKAFIIYLRSQKISNFNRKQIKQAIKIYNNLCEQNKFNNTLIKAIIYNRTIGSLFKLFLNEEARQWINFSRVSDKNLHYEAIAIFLKLYEKQASEGEGEGQSSSMIYGYSEQSQLQDQQ